MKRAIALTRRVPLQNAIPVILAVLLLPALWDRVSGIDPAMVGQSLSEIALWEWVAALGATGFSFFAVGQYDAVLHRALGTGIAPARARWAGMRAIALSQTLGLSALTGALVRWRVLPELDLIQSTRLSVFVGVSFLGAWAVVTLGVVALGGVGAALPGWVPLAAVAAILSAALVVRLREWLPKGWIPPLTAWDAGALVAWTLIDTGFAAAALWVFLPAEVAVAPMTFFAAYLLALGAGLMSNTPGGIGAFELTLIAVLPAVPEAPLLLSVLGFRVVYYLVPACLGLVALWHVRPAPAPPRLRSATACEQSTILSQTPRPDWGIVRQGGVILTGRSLQAGWLAARIGKVLVGIGPAFGRIGLADLRDYARQQGLAPMAYKISARQAAVARALGWAVLRTAAEARIDPALWSLDAPACRQLRRKLRHTEKSGLVARREPAPCPAELTPIAAEWAAACGGERGLSMGRYDPADLAHQRVYVARSAAGQALAFVTFRVSGGVWLLDLLRHQTDLPDGTMHLLIASAIQDARGEGCRHLSLAAVPAFAGRLGRMNGFGAGLARFKQSFAPTWSPVYATAPTRGGLWAGLALLAWAIQRPRPLPAASPSIDPRAADVALSV